MWHCFSQNSFLHAQEVFDSRVSQDQILPSFEEKKKQNSRSGTCHESKLKILNFLSSFAVAGFDMIRSRSWGVPVSVQKMNETCHSLSITIYHPFIFPGLVICFFSLQTNPINHHSQIVSVSDYEMRASNPSKPHS